MTRHILTFPVLTAALWTGLIGLSAAAATAASFDCSKARSYSEKLICATPELSYADEKLAEVYQQARRVTGNSKEFKDFVLETWKTRELCKDADCVNGWYIRAFYNYNRIVNDSAPDGEKTFLKGVSHCRILDLANDRLNEGLELVTTQGSRRTFNMYFNQVAMFLDFVDEEDNRVALGYVFEGKETDDARYFAMGLHDFDGDGVDEVICAATTDKRDAEEAFAIYVFRVTDGQHWLLSGASPVMPTIDVHGDRIRVPRQYGAYLEWTFINEKFHETGG